MEDKKKPVLNDAYNFVEKHMRNGFKLFAEKFGPELISMNVDASRLLDIYLYYSANEIAIARCDVYNLTPEESATLIHKDLMELVVAGNEDEAQVNVIPAPKIVN